MTGAGSVELVKVRSNLALVVEDPARRRALLAEAERQLTDVVGRDHPMTLDVRLTAAVLSPDPRAAELILQPTCATYARLHAGLGYRISECGFELGWLAQGRGARDELVAAMEQVVSSAGTGGEPDRVELARAYLLLARGEAAGAAVRFAGVAGRLGRQASRPWWLSWLAADAELGAALAERAAGRPRQAEAAFDRARSLLEAVERSHPAVHLQRRLAHARAQLAQLRAERRAPPAEVAPLARAAADWYRSTGAHADALAELVPLLGSAAPPD